MAQHRNYQFTEMTDTLKAPDEKMPLFDFLDTDNLGNWNQLRMKELDKAAEFFGYNVKGSHFLRGIQFHCYEFALLPLEDADLFRIPKDGRSGVD